MIIEQASKDHDKQSYTLKITFTDEYLIERCEVDSDSINLLHGKDFSLAVDPEILEEGILKSMGLRKK